MTSPDGWLELEEAPVYTKVGHSLSQSVCQSVSHLHSQSVSQSVIHLVTHAVIQSVSQPFT